MEHKIPDNCHWDEHEQDGESYCLRHLHPFEWKSIQPGTKDKPDRNYLFDVKFSIHCFTRDPYSNEHIHESQWYSDSRESRVFCRERYLLSHQLPEIIRSTDKHKVLNTKKGNFLTIEVIDEEGNARDYHVYFSVSRSSKKKGFLNLYVQSAYPEDTGNRPKHLKPIGLYVIAFNTLTKKPIK